MGGPNVVVTVKTFDRDSVDLVEIKLSCLDVFDREDAREKACLENARRELVAMMAAKRVIAPAPAAGFGAAASPSL